jgi:hypothetical protein
VSSVVLVGGPGSMPLRTGVGPDTRSLFLVSASAAQVHAGAVRSTSGTDLLAHRGSEDHVNASQRAPRPRPDTIDVNHSEAFAVMKHLEPVYRNYVVPLRYALTAERRSCPVVGRTS